MVKRPSRGCHYDIWLTTTSSLNTNRSVLTAAAARFVDEQDILAGVGLGWSLVENVLMLDRILDLLSSIRCGSRL